MGLSELSTSVMVRLPFGSEGAILGHRTGGGGANDRCIFCTIDGDGNDLCTAIGGGKGMGVA